MYCEINEFIDDDETLGLVLQYEKILLDAKVEDE
jgi:hypothetical protein